MGANSARSGGGPQAGGLEGVESGPLSEVFPTVGKARMMFITLT